MHGTHLMSRLSQFKSDIYIPQCSISYYCDENSYYRFSKE